MWASPPCQDWSRAGKREGANGDRNGWPWSFDVVDHARPRWLLAENVTGMLSHTDACKPQCSHECPAHYWHEVVLNEARKRFAWVGWRVLDAADFGVAQRRHRVFLVCGPRPIEWPEATHQDPKTLAQVDLFAPKRKPWASCGEALGVGVYALQTANGPGLTKDMRRVNDLTARPGLTVSASRMGPSAGGAMYTLGPDGKPRALSQLEAARLQDFPDDYPWCGSSSEQHRQVGNAVPPTLARVLAEAVNRAEATQ